jgi:hypothetical protein
VSSLAHEPLTTLESARDQLASHLTDLHTAAQ